MPKALRPCGEPGCPVLTDAGRCPAHRRPAWSGSTRRRRLPKDWRRRKAAVLRRDGHRCYRCGARATEVDHVHAGDDHRMGNLKAICVRCHRQKSSAEGNAARWGRGVTPEPPIS